MNRADLDTLVADVLGEHLEKFRADIERLVAEKAIPPFTPPTPWAPARYGAGATVRHRNGLFCARRDTSDAPPSDAWLPLLVGIASVGFAWADDRHMTLRVELSDGTTVETERDFAVPIARGFWLPDVEYVEGDRVLRFGDWQAAKPSKGIMPNGAENDGHWIKVTGKTARAVSFKLDDDGTLFENGHEIGTIKPLVANLLRDLVPA
jgi:hypothetical protein